MLHESMTISKHSKTLLFWSDIACQKFI